MSDIRIHRKYFIFNRIRRCEDEMPEFFMEAGGKDQPMRIKNHGSS